MLETSSHGDVVEIRMNRPPANALNHDMLEALLAAYADAIGAGARGLILSGRDGMFCAGIDVPGREARYIKLETKNDRAKPLLLQRFRAYGER